MMLPRYITHADWGTNPAKRQVAVAEIGADHHYQVIGLHHPIDGTAGNGELGMRLGISRIEDGQLLAGFDFPLGLPRAYAARAGINSFPEFFRSLAGGAAPEFSRVATTPAEISIDRPFYPARPGGTTQRQLLEGLGLTRQEIRRRCDGKDAESLFWTLGAKQVGKAALAGWAYLFESDQSELRLWPFDGSLTDLLDGDSATSVVAEVYPREFYRYFRAEPGTRGRKSRREDRRRWIRGLLDWSDHIGVTFDHRIMGRIESGFCEGPGGEDEFDAVVGVLGMIAVVTEVLGSGEPVDDPAVYGVEGWILGRQSLFVPSAGDVSARRSGDATGPARP